MWNMMMHDVGRQQQFARQGQQALSGFLNPFLSMLFSV
jgi:hypothetical protein